MTADQDLPAAFAAALYKAANEGMKATLTTGSWQDYTVDRLLSNSALLDDICEYRARQINAEVDAIAKVERKPQWWQSVYDIPFGMKFWGVPNGRLVTQVPWERFTADACRSPVAPAVESNRTLDASYPNGFSEVLE